MFDIDLNIGICNRIKNKNKKHGDHLNQLGLDKLQYPSPRLCSESYYCEYVRHLNVRIGEHIGISPLIKKQVEPKNSSVANDLLFCNHSASFDGFSILTCENKNLLLELKENLLIMRDKPSLNRKITLAPLYLFDKA